MLPLKLVRSLVLGEPMNQKNDDDASSSMATTTTTTRRRRARTPLLVFSPTTEIIHSTYRLSSIARDIGMDLYPNSSLSHIIFSWPSPSPLFPPSSSSSTTTTSSSSSSTTASSSTPLIHHYELPNGAVPLPFPTLNLASVSLLRYFVSISKGLFKLAFFDGDLRPEVEIDDRFSSWDCSSLSLVSRGTRFRVESMDGFSRVLTGHGWTMFQTTSKGLSSGSDEQKKGVFLFRKVDSNRVRSMIGEGRIRELRLPALDFNNVPLRILHCIILITHDIFYLA